MRQSTKTLTIAAVLSVFPVLATLAYADSDCTRHIYNNSNTTWEFSYSNTKRANAVPIGCDTGRNDLTEKQLIAQSGCCKQRKSDNHPWQKNGRSFNQCKELNHSLDGKVSIFQRSGLVWWDAAC